jgi:hypothetical protein
MKSLVRPVLAILTGALIAALAPASAAQNPAHAQLVVDGATTLGPMQGDAHGSWMQPTTGDGQLYAKLYDAHGVERFTLTAALTEYLFFVAAPAQGEIHGVLLVSPPPTHGVQIVTTQVYGAVEGFWIETPTGKGSFHASILPIEDPTSNAEIQPLGDIQGSFQILRTPAGRVVPVESAVGGGGVVAMNGIALAPQPIVVYPSTERSAAASPLLVIERNSSRRRPLDDHGGLGQVNGASADSGATLGLVTPASALGRATMRWRLFE